MADTLTSRVIEYGDSAIQVQAASSDRHASDEAAWAFVHELATWLASADIPGFLGAIPTYDSVLIEFDPNVVDHEVMHAFVRAWERLERDELNRERSRVYRIPVIYGGEYGPDIGIAATDLGLSTQELIEDHSNLTHSVRCLAQAGAPMFDGLVHLNHHVRRRPDPRVRVPGGSIMLANNQSIILPVESPSGWQIIGRTPVTFVDTTTEEILDYRPGDTFTYYSISSEEWAELEGTPLRDCLV